VADDKVSGASADAEAPNGDEQMTDETPESETTDAPDGVADVENVPEDAAPAEEPEPAEEPAGAEPTDEPAEEQAAEAETADEPAPEADAEAADPQPDEPQPAEPVAEGGAEPEEAAPEDVAPATEPEPRGEAAQVEPEPEPRGEAAHKKRKRLPRSLRPQKTRRGRVPSTERKAITRLPKPEHERGRRQERQGTVVSAGADKTIVVRVDVAKVHPMYKKVIKRSTKLHAHDETNEAKVGDIVRLVETRPLSKMKRWRLQEVVEAAK